MTKPSQTWLQMFPWLGFQKPEPLIFDLFLNKPAHTKNFRGEFFVNIILQSWEPTSFKEPGSARILKFGEMFPLIPNDFELGTLDKNRIPNGYKNKIFHAGYMKWGDIAGLEPDDLYNVRYLGPKMYVAFLEAFLLLSLSEVEQPTPVHNNELSSSSERLGVPQSGKSMAFDFDYRSMLQSDLIAQINEVMVRAQAMGLGDLNLGQLGNHEDFLAAGENDLFDTTPNEWLRGIEIPSVQEVLREWLTTMDIRLQTVLVGIYATKSTMSLDELASKLKISRERVRQLDAKLSRDFLGFCARNPLALVYFSIFSTLVGELSSERSLLKNQPLFKSVVGPKALRVIDIFCAVSENINRYEGWLTTFTPRELRSRSVKLIESSSNSEGWITYAQVTNSFQSTFRKLDSKDVATLVSNSGWTNFMGYMLNPEEIGMQDYAFVILESKKVPMTPQELLLAIGKDRTIGSLKNALSNDDRFDRVTKDSYGLRSWGMPSYSNISDMIVKYIEENGSVALSSLEKLFTSTYNVSANSIRVYASTFPLELVGGVVSKTSVKPVTRKALSDVRNVYKDNDRILLRLNVTSEHLRGSGVGVSAVFAANLGVDFGVSREFQYSNGKLRLSKPKTSAQLSSIRSICSELGLAEGDQVVLSFGKDDVTYSKVIIGSGNPELAVMTMLGIPQNTNRPLFQLIRERLGLSSKASSGELLTKLHDKRKEHDLWLILKDNPQILSK